MVTLFVVGLLAGGLLSGVVLGLLSGLAQPVPRTWRAVLIVAMAGLALLRELGLVRLRLPQNARQIPREVFGDLRRGALQFGFELGTGVRTYVSASAPYVLAVAVLLSGGELVVAVLAGLGFGLGRATTPLLRRASGDVARWDRELTLRLRTITVSTCAVLIIVFALLLW